MKKEKYFYFYIIIFTIILIISALMSLFLGSVKLDMRDVVGILVNKLLGREIIASHWTRASENIIWQLRFPKLIGAIVVGAALSLSGILMQTLTQNPLSEPYVLGISSGASTGAVMSLLLGAHLPLLGKVPISIGAFIGSLIACVLVYFFSISKNGISITSMILTGIAMSAGFGSLTNIIIFLTPKSHAVKRAMFWLSGSLSGLTWKDLPILIIIAILTIASVFYFKKTADIMLLGEEMARNYGLSIFMMRSLLVLVSSLITALIVSVSGVIGFVGLVIPHIGRILVGSKHSRLFPISIILGGILLIWSDLAARTWFAPEELPIGVVTSLVGVPFFLFLLKSTKERGTP